MMTTPTTTQLIDDRPQLTLSDLCRACAVPADWVVSLVEEGIIQPAGEAPVHWRFTVTCLRRVRRVHRLQRDLDINLPGAALVIELLDELESLRARVRRLERDDT